MVFKCYVRSLGVSDNVMEDILLTRNRCFDLDFYTEEFFRFSILFLENLEC